MIPIYAAPVTSGPEPTGYVVYKQSQLCRCGLLHSSTQIMAETWLRSTLGAGKLVHNIRRCQSDADIQYNLPIKLMEAPVEHVMFCHECYTTASLAHLPPVPAKETRIVAAHQAPPKLKVPKTWVKSTKVFTIDDL